MISTGKIELEKSRTFRENKKQISDAVVTQFIPHRANGFVCPKDS